MAKAMGVDFTREELITLCLTFPGAYLDHPFDLDWPVVRHRTGSNKIFALIYEREGRVRLNLKCDPVQGDFLRQVYRGVTPGFHMNKVHWNTVTMGTDVPEEELVEMIAESHRLTSPKKKRKGADVT